ncbi:MAG: glycosyl hydrolase, partial [Gammaproteobacteria bacterium]|nr:glycosyl hydrolase [Gammaproteobacteria bacterium]
YRTTDFGHSWTRIDAGIPVDEPTFVIREDTRDPKLLFAGTQRGIYASFDGGAHWQSLALNLPAVQVSDIAIQDRADDLVIATHGRAFWVLDDLSVLRQLDDEGRQGSTRLFTPDQAYLLPGFDFEGHAADQGENPPDGAAIFYNLASAPAKDAEITLSILSADGKQIRRFSSKPGSTVKPAADSGDFYGKPKAAPELLPIKAGMNRFVWDLRYPDATKVPGAVLWFGSMRGPKVPPGTYTLTLDVAGQNYSQPLTVLNDPRSKLSADDLAARQELLMQIYGELDKTDNAINSLRNLRTQINDLTRRYAKSSQEGALNEDTRSLLDELTAIEDALIQSKAKASEDVLNYPIRLNNKLAALFTSVEFSNSKPTQQDYAVFKQLAAQTDTQLARWQSVRTSGLPALNARITALKLPAIYLPAPPADAAVH